MRPGHRRPGGQEDERVEERQVPGVEGLDALRRPVPAGELGAGKLDRVVRVERGVEEGPEPGDEEHHLRGDEEDHAVAVADLHDAGVVALVARLADHAPPPVQHGVEDAEDAGAEDVRPDPEAEQRQALHRQDEADRHNEGRDRADERPGARIDEMVVVLGLGVRLGHGQGSPSPRSCVALSASAAVVTPRVTVSARPRRHSMSQPARRSGMGRRCRIA